MSVAVAHMEGLEGLADVIRCRYNMRERMYKEVQTHKMPCMGMGMGSPREPLRDRGYRWHIALKVAASSSTSRA